MNVLELTLLIGKGIPGADVSCAMSRPVFLEGHGIHLYTIHVYTYTGIHTRTRPRASVLQVSAL